MEFVASNVRDAIKQYWDEDKAASFIQQCLLSEENVWRAEYPWRKILFCAVSVRNVMNYELEHQDITVEGGKFARVGKQVAFKVEVADSMTELRQIKERFAKASTRVLEVEYSSVAIEPEIYKQLEQQLQRN